MSREDDAYMKRLDQNIESFVDDVLLPRMRRAAEKPLEERAAELVSAVEDVLEDLDAEGEKYFITTARVASIQISLRAALIRFYEK